MEPDPNVHNAANTKAICFMAGLCKASNDRRFDMCILELMSSLAVSDILGNDGKSTERLGVARA